MTYDEFLYITPRQFANAIGGYFEAEQRRVKESWEQTRLILSSIASKPVYGYRIKPKDPKQLLPFPWDNDGGAIPDKEELERLRAETWPQEQ